MVELLTEEINIDIIQYADKILEILKDWEPSNDTPPGRIILECRWLKQEVETNRLTYPDAYQHITSIRHTYVAEDMLEEHYEQGIKRYFGYIIDLCNKHLLIKPVYYSFTIQMIEVLIKLLNNPGRSLSEHEKGLIPELEQLKQLLAEGKIEPPLMSYFPDYPNFRKVYRLNESTIDDLIDGKYLCETVANLVFEGIRPDSWLTPEDAERETQSI